METPAAPSSPTSVKSTLVIRDANEVSAIAVDSFAHASWKTSTSVNSVGMWDPSTMKDMAVVALSTTAMGRQCHKLDMLRDIKELTAPIETEELRPADRDGKQRPIQPGELPLDAAIPWPSGSNKPWYVPFHVMPNMNGHGELFERWDQLVLQLVNDHRLPNTDMITDLAQAHKILPYPGTKSFGMDLHLEAQMCLSDRLTAEWEGREPTPQWLGLFTDTIRQVVQPYMAQYYPHCNSKFYVQKHPKNLRMQMPGMKSVEHWHSDRMFGHPQGEINFSLCLTEFKRTAGISICLELPVPGTDKREYRVVPIMAGAGSVVVAPFGYCPHGNFPNNEEPHHTRCSIDWRIILMDDMERAMKDKLGASATSGLPYTPGAYYGLWDSTINDRGDWAKPPKQFGG